MPGCGLHLVIADRVFRRDTSDPALRAAFLAGSVAPDLGYFPGGTRFLSDLAHYVGTGRLTRTLSGSAGQPSATAFAHGWATHVIADRLIHPLVNKAAGELSGLPTPLTFADNPAAHVRVEQGLDAVIAARYGVHWPAAAGRYLCGPAVGLLEWAYSQSYGYQPPRRAWAASARAIARGVPIVLGYGRAVARLFDVRGPTPARSAACVLFGIARTLGAVAPKSAAMAFAKPVQPTDSLLSPVVSLIDRVVTQLGEAVTSGFASLADFNLDTGEPEKVHYPLAAETLARLSGIVSCAEPANALGWPDDCEHG